jgi:hypothetical protein
MDRFCFIGLAGSAANLYPVHERHHPIQDSHLRRIFPLQHFPCCGPVGDRDNIVATVAQRILEQMARHALVLGD